MKEAQRKVVILPTKTLTQEFRERTAKMTTVDYDMEELAVGIVHCLSNRSETDQQRFRRDFLKSLEEHGSFTRDPSPDGEILSGAVGEYMDGIKTIIDRAALYEPNGTLDFMFDSFYGDDMVLTEWPD